MIARVTGAAGKFFHVCVRLSFRTCERRPCQGHARDIQQLQRKMENLVMIMKRIAPALLAAFLLAGTIGTASAECTVQGWANGNNNYPIWKCSE
jgi:hypothetical protein